MKGHKFYTDWDEFWEFYMSKVKKDIGANKMKVLSYEQISRRLPRIPDREVLDVISPIVREHGYLTDSITLRYDPNVSTFYSTYDKSKKRGKRIVVGFPTFTRYMIHWKPAIEAAFRHELGHILRKDIFKEFNYGGVRNANTCMDIRINANLHRESLTSVYKCLYYKDTPVELLVPEEQFYKINLPYDEKNPYVPSWRVICDHYNDANEEAKDDTMPGGLKEPPSGFQVGDLVMIDSETSEYNDRYGKIIEIDDETGEYIVEEASQEEVDEVLEMSAFGVGTLRFSTQKDAEFFGGFNEDELLPLTPQDDQPGEYGDEGEPQPGGEGEGEEEESEGEGGEEEESEGEGEESEENQSSIDRKEEILENLKNGGVDGEPSDQPFLDDDEESTDWADKYEESEEKEGERKEGEEEEESEGEGEGEEEESEGEGGEEEESEGEGEEEESEEKPGKSEREKEIEEKIRENQLKKRIQQSYDNFSKIKENYKDVLSKQETDVLDKEIEELNKLL